MTRAQLLGLSIGVVIAVALPAPGITTVTGLILAVGVLVLRWLLTVTLAYRIWPVRLLELWRGSFPVFMCAVAGLVTASAQFHIDQLAHIEQVNVKRVSGCIVSQVTLRNDAYRFAFESVERTLLGRAVRYRVTWYRPDTPPVAGSCWRVWLRLKPLRGALNEAGFDYERWLFAQRFSGLGSVKSSVTAVKLPWQSANASYLAARGSLYSQIAALTENHQSSMLIGALAVGIRDGLTDADWATLRRSGTAHLMAISGLHVGLAAMFGFAVGRYVPFRVHAHTNLNRRGAVTSLLVATLYAGIAGFAVSTVRALLMLVLWHVWRLVRRSVDVTTTLLLTVASVLLLTPWMAADIGFWLSAGAVFAITAAVYGRPSAVSAGAKIRLAIRIQLGVTMLMLPVAVFVAGGVSWISVPVNLILIPLFSFCIVPLVLVLLASVVAMPAAAPVIATALAGILDGIWRPLVWMAEQPWAYSPVASLSPWLTMPVALCGLIMLLPSAFPTRWTGCLLLIPLFFSRAEKPAHGEFWLDVLDVGQALAVIVQTRSGTSVYDTGNAWPGGDSAQWTILPVLRKRQVVKLQAMIVSHADRDHAGGALSLHQSMPVDVVWVGEPVENLIDARTCRRGVRWRHAGVRFEFLHPPVDSTHEGNEQSCVLLITGNNSSALLTGDLGRAQERGLLTDLRGHTIDVVVGAHHGSLSSSDPRFIESTQPAFVVFSNAYANQWGMPREEVVLRWHSVGTRVLTTAGSGQVRFKSRANGPLALESRLRERYFGVWRWRSDRG